MKKSLNKKELADLLAEEFDITKKAALEEVQFLLDEITAQLVKGNSVDLSGFGKFSVKERKVTVEAKKAVSFKAAKGLKEKVN